MARLVKGAKRYLLFRGRDEDGNKIVIDIFGKKELEKALKEGRITKEDYVVGVEVCGKVDLKEARKD